jgi:hypothetical protein
MGSLPQPVIDTAYPMVAKDFLVLSLGLVWDAIDAINADDMDDNDNETGVDVLEGLLLVLLPLSSEAAVNDDADDELP